MRGCFPVLLVSVLVATYCRGSLWVGQFNLATLLGAQAILPSSVARGTPRVHRRCSVTLKETNAGTSLKHPFTLTDLAHEILPKILGVNYTTLQKPGGAYKTAAEVVISAVESLEFRGHSDSDEALSFRDAVRTAQAAFVGRWQTPLTVAPVDEGIEDRQEHMELTKHFGEVVFTSVPLPIGVIFDCRTYRVRGLGSKAGFETVVRISLPGVKSQVFSGAIYRSEQEAEGSAASVLHQSLASDASDARKGRKDTPVQRVMSFRPQDRSAAVLKRTEDVRAKTARRLRERALEHLRSCRFDIHVSELPVAGFQALAELSPQERGTRWQKRMMCFDRYKSHSEDEPSRFLGDVCGTAQAAAVSAQHALFEALLERPAWKTTAFLRTSPATSGLPLGSLDVNILELCRRWRSERLEAVAPGGAAGDEALAPASLRNLGTSFDLWFGGVCLCCLSVVSYASWPRHVAGERHAKSFKAAPVRLKSHLERPETAPEVRLWQQAPLGEELGWGDAAMPILSVGEMDFSFSLALARLREKDPHSVLLATSYLQACNPSELEWHPDTDAERARFRRNALPSMAGALQRNLRELRDLGAEVLHGVDATDLHTTLRASRFRGFFGRAVFPFPRASLRREQAPQNSELIRGFFRSAAPGAGILVPDGEVQLVLLGSQYVAWDVAALATDAGLRLTQRVPLPRGFYQPREVSGRAWDFGSEAEVFCFQRVEARESQNR